MKLSQLILLTFTPLAFFVNLSANAADVYIKDRSGFAKQSLKEVQQTKTILFSDVFPGDWAYTALQNLISSYGCVDNPSLQSLRIGQALTRYEAAELLNSCLEGDISLANSSSEVLRLYNEFSFEIAIVKARYYQLN